jgi:hypothetical protein
MLGAKTSESTAVGLLCYILCFRKLPLLLVDGEIQVLFVIVTSRLERCCRSKSRVIMSVTSSMRPARATSSCGLCTLHALATDI